MPEKITMKNALVEMDGDEMTRVMWAMIKEKLLAPFIDLKTEYYDLGLRTRDETNDAITLEAAEAIKKHGVGVKCATITPDKNRITEYSLKQEWKSPNATIRAQLDGTVFRKPILVRNITPAVCSWKKPIIVGRHAYGDVYKNTEFKVPGPGRAELVYTDSNGKELFRGTIHEFKKGGGVIQGMHNTDASISSFAKACMEYALDQKVDLWFGAKDTISKTYDGNFRNLFMEVFDREYKDRFATAHIAFNFTLIDDTVARIMKSEGGMLWACKNYDGDVMSDMVASSFGSLAMMTSVLVSPNGWIEYEAAHGTVQRHYYKHLKGEQTSSNCMATLFAWTGALRKRGELDGQNDLADFADAMEAAAIATIESGLMTGDLARLANPAAKKICSTGEFIDEIGKKFRAQNR
ncbi:MAG: NADP-dependent isocitrate dehydrogenase [Chitinispirillaceae bacterium]|nr:NADP-dependent isocitrate dehydrogenase [Chitinispirillaceae bacterium]